MVLLKQYTIFHNPPGYPDCYVVRPWQGAWEVRPETDLPAYIPVIVHKDLEYCRHRLRQLGLHPHQRPDLPISTYDDPTIVETWS